ncbi:FAD-dependent oxidoreductase [Sphingomonas sp. PP-F2F-G114-C0414]|uniref:FAD-dependent oxidoreductase n=1 Tax=Sphingomonas sp. PP-F2F-G114-C0414 TaxID=2135662 RepID=UPI00217F1885|nr:FAD-dependent oxidoreductase [Sphingomonas sp. PP-F2F-G114-C0414]
MRSFDAIIVGAGQAGPPLAGRLTAKGWHVALIERHLVGGTCVNTGCMPTKTLVASAYAAHLARRGARISGYGQASSRSTCPPLRRGRHASSRTHAVATNDGSRRWSG